MTKEEIVENARSILYGHDPEEAFSGAEIRQISAALGVARIVLRVQQKQEKFSIECNQRLVQAESAPTITPESLVRHGKWGRKYMNRSCYFFCSECHFDGLGAGSNYCPHCGAKMDMEASKTEAPEQGRYR